MLSLWCWHQADAVGLEQIIQNLTCLSVQLCLLSRPSACSSECCRWNHFPESWEAEILCMLFGLSLAPVWIFGWWWLVSQTEICHGGILCWLVFILFCFRVFFCCCFFVFFVCVWTVSEKLIYGFAWEAYENAWIPRQLHESVSVILAIRNSLLLS